MGKIKQNKLGEKKYTLTDREWDYLKILNTTLQFHTLKDKILSGFLYYICNQRLGYSTDVNLIFECDFKDDSRELKIREVPNEAIEQALHHQEPEQSPKE